MFKSEFPSAYLWIARIVVLAIFIVLPFAYPQKYVVHIVNLAMIFAIAALALQLLLGFTGLLSIGQAAFLGIGAYTSAILTTTYKLPFEIAFITAGLLAGFASLTLVPITRLRGVYLGVATLGFSRAVLEGGEVPVPLESSICNMVVIDALVRSVESRQWEECRG